MTVPSPAIVLLSALLGCRGVAGARAFLEARSHPHAAEALVLLERHEAGAVLAIEVLEALGEGLPSLPPEEWAARYDRAVAINPEASVALYSLADPGLLADSTAEMVVLLQREGLVGRDKDVLEIGCGIGRFATALAPLVRRYTGIDVSAGMVETARRRALGLANVAIEPTAGRDLAGFADASVELVMAIDMFPYLVAGAEGLAERHFAEAARVLKPGGSFLIMNYSYRDDVARDRSDAAHHAVANGLAMRRNGTRDTEIWDGVTFLMRRDG